VFVYGVASASASGKLDRIAIPSIRRQDPSARILVAIGAESIHAAYNSILDEASPLVDLECLVLLHDDVQIRDPSFEAKLRVALGTPGVAIVGVVGGLHHQAMQWWTGQKRGHVTDNQQGVLDFGRGKWPVDTVDGLMLALSPWAVRNLRFDTKRYHGFHGYDADICAQARSHGQRVMVWDLDVYHDNDPNNWYGDKRGLRAADLTWRLKWRSDATMAKRFVWAIKRRAILAAIWIDSLRRKSGRPIAEG
jgi:hypothetical protein